MCGIVGTIDVGGAPAQHAILKRMTDAVAHRGPDGEGHYADGPVGLGHRRLAIIDLTPAGRQPMVSEDGRYVITYNGEVYNFRELRVELEAAGVRFHTRTDAEVVLKALIQWGKKALHRFNGMFALALWDARERRMLLARDRYGIKPLYWTQAGSTIVFASEVKALLEHPLVQKRPDLEGLLEYLSFQNFFTDRTLYRKVRLLPAGSLMELCIGDSAAPVPEQYWDFDFREPVRPADEAEYVAELDRLFRQAVTRQLVSDVDIGTYLSGGMDSGSITACAAKELPYIRSFTCGFDLNSAAGVERGYDERANAEFMSYLFKTEHYEMVLKSGDMERIMPRVVHHLEEPRVGQCYPNFYVAQLASKFVKVVLSGTGGDELFGGYPWRYFRAADSDDFEHYIDKYYAFWQRLVPNTVMPKLLAPVWNDVKHISSRDIFRSVFKRHAQEFRRPEDYVNHSLYFEAKTFLHGLLVVEDKLSMAHGLETRVPFLDDDLVEFAMQVPTAMKINKLIEVARLNENDSGDKVATYYRQTRDGKLLLRKMMDRHVPAEVTNREKQGFSAPDASWFKGESIDYVRRRLYDGHARIYDLLDRKTVQALVNDHLEGRENRRLLIWSLLYLEEWCETIM